ncbi:MAG TPA: Zn-dependent protease [Aquifex aeolicus]|nr:Zn-dependent protease [Aquifex aeolicus]
MGYIYIVSFGNVEDRLLLANAGNVKDIFDLDVRVSTVKADISVAYNPRRNQYHAGTILNHLSGIVYPNMVRLIALVGFDLYEEGLNFVFGEAQYGGKYAVVSTFRLQHINEEVFFERAFKESNHELGHTFGLKHCNDPYCVMSFSNTISDVDRKSRDFCPKCRRKLDYVLSYYR